jgi:hypothetical protein
MTRLTPILLPLILTLAPPAMANAGPEKKPAAHARPLNLSLPREMLSQTPPNGTPDETTLRNLQAPAPTENTPAAGSLPPGLPYGAGYEHRQQDMQGPSGGAGMGGAGTGGAGGGRRGR